jgi:hypothetical protein
MRARVLCLRLWWIAMAASTLNALRIVLTDRDGFATAFPGADGPAGRVVAVVLPLSLLISIVGLWRWRRWGLWLLAAASSATLAFDVLVGGPPLHLAAAIASILISAALLAWNRDGFVARDTEASG